MQLRFHALHNSSGSLAMFAAVRRASSRRLQNVHGKWRPLKMMIFIEPHTPNDSEFTELLKLCYDHFCTAGFQSNAVAFFKRHRFFS
jgi:hypothetical protein